MKSRKIKLEVIVESNESIGTLRAVIRSSNLECETSPDNGPNEPQTKILSIKAEPIE